MLTKAEVDGIRKRIDDVSLPREVYDDVQSLLGALDEIRDEAAAAEDAGDFVTWVLDNLGED